jgi:hypothetical protein
MLSASRTGYNLLVQEHPSGIGDTWMPPKTKKSPIANKAKAQRMNQIYRGDAKR